MHEISNYRDAVLEIKKAILQSRYQAARLANKEQLILYYSIGRYVSENTRSGKWGTGAIEAISEQLQAELPGLRGYSPSNIKNMRVFYEEWMNHIEPNRQLTTGDLVGIREDEIALVRQLPTSETISADSFLRIGFTHHCEILAKCKSIEARLYYIQKCVRVLEC